MFPKGSDTTGLVRGLDGGEDGCPEDQEQEVEGDEEQEANGRGPYTPAELHRATGVSRVASTA